MNRRIEKICINEHGVMLIEENGNIKLMNLNNYETIKDQLILMDKCIKYMKNLRKLELKKELDKQNKILLDIYNYQIKRA